MNTSPAQLASALVSAAVRQMPGVVELGRQFELAGFELALVGGSVRDIVLDRPVADLDFTTNATPDQIIAALQPWADSVWDVGIAFGTVGARRGALSAEITTYRAEQYDPESRKPDVVYGASLEDDLGRRDFTINAMALRLPEQSFVDLYGGLEDLAAGLIRTPGTPEQSFSDDPLRMLRAARFSAQLGFEVADDVVAAMVEQEIGRAHV